MSHLQQIGYAKKTMRQYIIRHWYQIAVYVAGAYGLILALGQWNLTQRTLLASLMFIHLHFYEEMGFPGGFPWIGMTVELNMDSEDPRQWELTELSSFFGNGWFAVVVYLLPLLLPQLRFLTLASVVFAFAEVAMHLFYFNITMKVWYNPGLLTSVFGLLPLSVNYLARTIPTGTYNWLDLAMALIWIILNYWIAFRSSLYKKLGTYKTYSFTSEEVERARPYMDIRTDRAKKGSK